jgi:hypothetical protein
VGLRARNAMILEIEVFIFGIIAIFIKLYQLRKERKI